jgi:predicted oxidoreductase
MISRAQLCPNGPEISEIVLGTWRLLDDYAPPSAHALVERIDACIDLGITTIDTAEIYGLYEVEEALGKVFAHEPTLRDKVEIISKCGIDVPSNEKADAKVCHYNATAENLSACTEKSLRLLNTDHLDILLVHRPDWFASADETAKGLTQLLDQGKIKHAGVSNYTADQFELLQDRMGDVPLVTNQVEINLLAMDTLYDGTLSQCERLHTRPMAWSPLGGGRLFDPSNPAGVRILKAMEAMRSRYNGANDDALAFAWVMAHPSRPIPVIGSNRIERITSTAKAGSIQMERQDWYALWEAAKGESVP